MNASSSCSPSDRALSVEPFQVMRLLARARELEAQGRSIIHLEVGEPDFPTPAPIIAAAQEALQTGRIHYTPAVGLADLRARIAAYYGQRYGVTLDAGCILVTPGASGALQLLFHALLEPGDQVLLCDPSYPCYRQVLRLLGVEPVFVPVHAETDYQLTAQRAEEYWGERVRAVVVATPSNPTGSVIDPAELAALHALCRKRGVPLIVDEIYQGLTYDAPDHTALALGQEGLHVINSFSKYFGMTGWRLGWLVAAPEMVAVMDRLAQNLFIAANTLAQQAALVAFEPQTLAILEERRACFRQRRDALLPALCDLGFGIRNRAEGAFYLYASLPEGCPLDSMQFCTQLLEQAGVAVTPGADFGMQGADRHVRFAYTCEIPRLTEAVRRIGAFLS